MRVALIDSDIVAYKASALAQEDFDFGNGTSARVVDKELAREQVDRVIEEHTEAVNADRAIVCLSDPDVNWRKQLDPTYKAHRQNKEVPELLMAAKEYLYEEYRSYIRPRLEADDVMGILATRPRLLGEAVTEAVIVSEDKDMRTIPAKVYHPHRPANGIMEITPTEAKQFHMWQTITGDPTDGYPGVPGVGPKSPYAQDALEITDPLEMWDNVLLAFASKGLTEDDAIRQARLARILHADDYNFKNKKIRLWDPTRLHW